MPTTLQPVITASGLAALVANDKQGLEASITHVALGDGNGSGYNPQRGNTQLRNERARVAVGGGQAVSPTEFVVSALLDAGPNFWIREVGFIVDDSVFLAIWSDPASPLQYYKSGQQLILDYYLAVDGIPPGSVTINITNPTINILVAGPIAQLSAEIIRLQRRAIESENARLIPNIGRIQQ